jgi:hypothetical protein
MGRDNPPRERQRRDLERGLQRGRAPCERILIVSEGSKTEPFYFDEIRVTLRLPVRNITVTGGELGTDPVQVVQYARSLFERGDPHKGMEPRAFDRVFAVFDRDQHRGYADALSQAEALDGKLKNDEKRRVPFKAREAAVLDEILSEAEEGGIVVVPPLKPIVEEKLGRSICLATLYNLLHRHGWRKLVPDTRPPKGDEKALEDWKKTARRTGRNHPELPGKTPGTTIFPG